MWALIIYVVFVVVGGLISVGIGSYVETEFNSGLSLIVFLTLFFANFIFSWFLTMAVVDKVMAVVDKVAPSAK